MFRQFLFYARLLELRKVFDEHLALQMIHLVLDADGEQSLGFEFEGCAIQTEGAHFNLRRALHGFVDAGNRQAALLALAFARPLQ